MEDEQNPDPVKISFPGSVSLLLLPGLVVGPLHREQESQEHKQLFCQRFDPAAEREESNYYLASWWKNKHIAVRFP